ncbi:MAG: aspartate aminotransferase family protein [Bacteroidia bacterium]|nr:aspartate aminotransferase family protein [Bacteroidia bacterium]
MSVHNLQPLLNKTYPKAASAKGVYIYDKSGKQYLDGSSGAVTSSLGHSHAKIIPFIKQQLDKLQFVYRSQFGSEEAEALATKLFAVSVNKSHAHSFFVNSGTEAIETAMKIAVQYWQEKGQPEKVHFLSRWKSYHGITMAALSLSGHALRRQRFEGSLQKYPALYADLEKDSLQQQRKEFIEVIEKKGAKHIAAFVAEPMVGAAGTALTPHPEYYQEMKKICDDYGILFIADEVMTGLGRTGKWFALEHWQTVADIVTIGKSLGAGYAPIAATLMTDKILDPIKKGSGLIMSGHTYSGHPLSCATALRVLEVIEEDNLLSNVTEKGVFIKNRLMELKDAYPFIDVVRGKGLMMGIEFNPSRKGLQARFIDQCFNNGLLVYPAVGGATGEDENGILISPPFILNQIEAEELLYKFEKSLNEINN